MQTTSRSGWTSFAAIGGGQPVAHRARERRELRAIAAEDVEPVRPDGEVSRAARDDRVGAEPLPEHLHHIASSRPRRAANGRRSVARYAACAASSSPRCSRPSSGSSSQSASRSAGPRRRCRASARRRGRARRDPDGRGSACAQRRAGRSSRSRPSRCRRAAHRRRAARRHRGGARGARGRPRARGDRRSTPRCCRRSPGSATPRRRGCRSPRTSPRAPARRRRSTADRRRSTSGRSAPASRPRIASSSAAAGAAWAGAYGRRVGDVDAGGEDVLGQREDDRPRATRRRDTERARDELGDALDLVDLRDPLRERAEHAPVVELLERLPLGVLARDLADEEDERRPVLERRVHADRRLRRARPTGDEADPGRAGQLPVRLRHVRRARFVPARDEPHRRVAERVEDVDVALARDAEREPRTVERELVDEELPAGAAHDEASIACSSRTVADCRGVGLVHGLEIPDRPLARPLRRQHEHADERRLLAAPRRARRTGSGPLSNHASPGP